MKTLVKCALPVVALTLALPVVSCGGGNNRTVQRTSADEVTDYSGRWNDTDARMVAEEMISDCLSRPWLNKFKEESGRAPVVRVRLVKNRSREHIDVNVFTKQIERALLNSGEIEFKAKTDEINQLRAEQEEGASGYVADDSAPDIGNEAGVVFVLIGQINMMLDQSDNLLAKTYQITMELHNTTTAKKAWIGEKDIKKIIKQKKSTW